MRQSGLHEMQGAAEVNCEDPPEGVEVEILDRSVVARNTGASNETVQPSGPLGNSTIDRLGNSGTVCDVKGVRRGACASRPDLIGDCGSSRVIEIGAYDVRALRCDAQGTRAPQAIA